MSLKREISDQFFARASKVIPGGIYGHVAPAAGLPRFFPHYIKSATGCMFEDVDGNEYGIVYNGKNDNQFFNISSTTREIGRNSEINFFDIFVEIWSLGCRFGKLIPNEICKELC